MKSLRTSLTLFLLIAFCAHFSIAQKSIDKSFSGIDKIEMSVGSGDAVFKKTASNEIQLNLTHSYNFDYNPTIEKRGSKLVIEDDDDMPRNTNGSATWTFELPDGIDIEFNTGSGDAELKNIVTEASMNSGSGDFEISDVNGEFTINTGSGDIEMDNSKGELGLNTGSGDIEIDGMTGEARANTGSGDIEGKNIEVTAGSTFNSGSGDVELSLSSALEDDISLNSGSGDAVLDFQGNKITGEIVMEVNKQYGKIVAPFEFDKTEEIGDGRNAKIRKIKRFGSADIRVKISSGSGTAEIKE